jgi:hypothetical protein
MVSVIAGVRVQILGAHDAEILDPAELKRFVVAE